MLGLTSKLSSGNTLVQATRDHSVTYMKYLGGEITRMDVYHDIQRAVIYKGTNDLRACAGPGGTAQCRRQDQGKNPGE